jgi:hypothetical protein
MENFNIQKKCFMLTFFHRNQKFEISFKAVQLMFFTTLTFCVFANSLYVFVHWDEVSEAAEAFGPCTTGSLAFVKMVTFYFLMDKFYGLMEKLNKLSHEGLNNFCDQNENLFNDFDTVDLSCKTMLINANRFDQGIAAAYLISASFTAFSLCLTPVAKNIVIWAFDSDDFNRDMPVKSAFFYDATQSPLYEITYMIFIIGSFGCVLISVSLKFIKKCDLELLMLFGPIF